MTLTVDKGKPMGEKKVKKQTCRNMGLGDIFNANMSMICLVRNINDEQVIEYMNVCRSTFYDRKLHHPEKWTAGNIDSAAKLFKIPSCDMTSRMLRPEEVS